MNTPVSFDTAKLLKEKGYNEHTTYFYTKPNSKMFGIDEHGRTYPIKNTPKRLYMIGEHATLKHENAYFAPTISEVIMWLYDKHGIWVWVSMELGYTNTFCWQLTGEHTSSNYKAFFKTPTDAYVDAITYTLNNLI